MNSGSVGKQGFEGCFGSTRFVWNQERLHTKPGFHALPVEEKNDELIAIYTSSMLTTGENDDGARFAAPDRIEYKGKQWRVVRVRDWSDFNYYQALAVLVKEEGTG